MRRRDFLKGLFVVPAAAAVAKLVPETPAPPAPPMYYVRAHAFKASDTIEDLMHAEPGCIVRVGRGIDVYESEFGTHSIISSTECLEAQARYSRAVSQRLDQIRQETVEKQEAVVGELLADAMGWRRG